VSAWLIGGSCLIYCLKMSDFDSRNSKGSSLLGNNTHSSQSNGEGHENGHEKNENDDMKKKSDDDKNSEERKHRKKEKKVYI
jgi:hypothetical protein